VVHERALVSWVSRDLPDESAEISTNRGKVGGGETRVSSFFGSKVNTPEATHFYPASVYSPATEANPHTAELLRHCEGCGKYFTVHARPLACSAAEKGSEMDTPALRRVKAELEALKARISRLEALVMEVSLILNPGPSVEGKG